MDEQSKRMLLLGRQAPPKAIDLKLEPRTYVSPNHAPVADVSYRVEKHIPISDPGNKAERKARQEVKARPAPSDNLEEFQNRVRLRAAKVQREMREKQLEQQKQMQAKKESLDRRKAYARRVAAANTEARRRHKEAEEASSSGYDSDSSSDDSADGKGEEAAGTERAASQPATDTGSEHTTNKKFGPQTLQDPYNPPPAVKVVRGPTNEPPPVASPAQPKKSIPAAARVKRQPVDASGIWRPAQNSQGNDMSCSSSEEPWAPPQPIWDHVEDPRRQESLHHDAEAPQLTSDDLLGTNSVDEYRRRWQPDTNQQSPPHYALNHQRMHSSEPGSRADPQQTPDARAAVLREHDNLTSPEMIALWQRQCEDLDAVREETQAQSTAVSGSEWAPGGYQDPMWASFYCDPYHAAGDVQGRVGADYTQLHPGAPFQPEALGLCRPPVGRNLPSPTPSVASLPVLEREAGGGTGLAGKAAPTQVGALWGGMLHDRTNVQAVDTSGFVSDHDAWSKFAAGAAEYTDGRSDDELPLCGAFAKQHIGKGQTRSVLSNTMLQKIQQKVDELQLQLPALCACHDVPVLDPSYTSYCHPECQFYNNEERFSKMLKGLLETWGIIEP